LICPKCGVSEALEDFSRASGMDLGQVREEIFRIMDNAVVECVRR